MNFRLCFQHEIRVCLCILNIRIHCSMLFSEWSKSYALHKLRIWLNGSLAIRFAHFQLPAKTVYESWMKRGMMPYMRYNVVDHMCEHNDHHKSLLLSFVLWIEIQKKMFRSTHKLPDIWRANTICMRLLFNPYLRSSCMYIWSISVDLVLQWWDERKSLRVLFIAVDTGFFICKNRSVAATRAMQCRLGSFYFWWKLPTKSNASIAIVVGIDNRFLCLSNKLNLIALY